MPKALDLLERLKKLNKNVYESYEWIIPFLKQNTNPNQKVILSQIFELKSSIGNLYTLSVNFIHDESVEVIFLKSVAFDQRKTPVNITNFQFKNKIIASVECSSEDNQFLIDKFTKLSINDKKKTVQKIFSYETSNIFNDILKIVNSGVVTVLKSEFK